MLKTTEVAYKAVQQVLFLMGIKSILYKILTSGNVNAIVHSMCFPSTAVKARKAGLNIIVTSK